MVVEFVVESVAGVVCDPCAVTVAPNSGVVDDAVVWTWVFVVVVGAVVVVCVCPTPAAGAGVAVLVVGVVGTGVSANGRPDEERGSRVSLLSKRTVRLKHSRNTSLVRRLVSR